jgi:hypothetical protein
MMRYFLSRSRLLALGLLCLMPLVACTREYVSPPTEEDYIDPQTGKRMYLSQAQVLERAQAFIKALAFSQARRQLEFLRDQTKRDSLRAVVAEMESFADAYLIYAVDSYGDKSYIYNKELVAYYQQHGYISHYEGFTPTLELKLESQRGQETDICIPDETTELMNVGQYQRLVSLTLDAAKLTQLDLRGLTQLEQLTVRNAREGLRIELSSSARLKVLTLENTPNVSVRLHPDSRYALSLKNTYIRTLDDLGITQTTSVSLDNVLLADNDLFSKVSESLHSLVLSSDTQPRRGTDGVLYRPITFTTETIKVINRHLPSLSALKVIFSDQPSLERVDFSQLSQPHLRTLTLDVRDRRPYVGVQDWNTRVRMHLPHCPALRELTLGPVYTQTLDLATLTEQANPQLELVEVRFSATTCLTPALTHKHRLHMNVGEVKRFDVPQPARGKAFLYLNDYNLRNEYDSPVQESPQDLHIWLRLDEKYLREHFAGIAGYPFLTLPSEYIPRSREEHVTFAAQVLDFSAPQWRGFEGTVSMAKEVYPSYLDFGYLTIRNIRSIQVAANCLVKNRPQGVRVTYVDVDTQN